MQNSAIDRNDTAMNTGVWPPVFSLDQPRILQLLTGDRFYSNPSAALREAVLNAIDAIHRRQRTQPDVLPRISLLFDRSALTLTIEDNGIGMCQHDVSELFAKVGASAANMDAKKDSVGEFGIGVISYFMAGHAFELQTNSGDSDPIGLRFERSMIVGGPAIEIPATQVNQGTQVTIHVRDEQTFQLLVDRFPYWCRDVTGLVCTVMPENSELEQLGTNRPDGIVLETPTWIERAHLTPTTTPSGWDSMTGTSTISVLYRGVFVQDFSLRGVWGIEGSIDVDPKHFKPRLNREAFVESDFRPQVESFLRSCHPKILEAMAAMLARATQDGTLDKWTERRWASLWLSVPRGGAYANVAAQWDAIFRALPAFELAIGNRWRPVSLNEVAALEGDVYIAPLAHEKSNDVIAAAVRFLRNAGYHVVRGIQKDTGWNRFAPSAYASTADLIVSLFSSQLPPLKSIPTEAQRILSSIRRIAPLFTGPPQVDLVRLGEDSAPALRVRDGLVINIDNPKGVTLLDGILIDNRGHESLITVAARCAPEHLPEVAAVVKTVQIAPEVLSPIRRRFIRSCLK